MEFELSLTNLQGHFFLRSRDSSVGIATRLRADDRRIGVRFPARKRDFLFSVKSRAALGPTQPPIQWLLVPVSPGVKRHVSDSDHSSPSSYKVKNGGAIPPSPYFFMAW
jgi:hypothetical protein